MATTKRSPATNERLQELRRRLNALRSVTPVRNQYTFEGTKYTKRGYDQLIKSVENEISQVEKELSPTVFEIGEAEAKTKRELTQETQKIRLDYNSVQARRKDIEKAISRATTVAEQQNLQTWLALFNENERRLKTALDQYESGQRPVSIPEPIQLVSVEQMKRSTPTGPVAPEATGTPQPAASVTQPTPLTAGQRGEMGVGVTSRMPSISLEQINAARSRQGLPAVELVNGRYREVSSKKDVPASDIEKLTGQLDSGAGIMPVGGTGEAAVGGTPTGAVPPATTTPTQLVGSNGQVVIIPPTWEEAAQQIAPRWWAVFKDNEEMRKFMADWMTKPVAPGVDPFGSQFMLALQRTNWWTGMNDKARLWTRLEVERPGEAASQLEKEIANLKKIALDRGLSTDEALLRKAALDVAKFGLTYEMALNNLASSMQTTSTGASELRQGYYGQRVRELANQYGIAMSDSAITNSASLVATGQQTLESLKTQFREQAKVMYPSLAGGLDRGLTFEAMASPYANFASSILEIPMEQIDFRDPKWSAAFNSRDNKGNVTQMSFSEWQDYLRTDPQFGWEYTDNAKSQVYDIALQIGRMFGRAG